MKPLNEHDIQDLLTDLDTVEAPAGLAESIKAEIPADLALPSTVPTVSPTPLRRRAWLPLAASLLALVGGGYLAHRTLLTAPNPITMVEGVVEAPQVERPSEDLSTVEAPTTEHSNPEPTIDLLRRIAPEPDGRVQDDETLRKQQGLQNLDSVDLPVVRGQNKAVPPAAPPALAKPAPIIQNGRSRLREGSEGTSRSELRQEEAKPVFHNRRRKLDKYGQASGRQGAPADEADGEVDELLFSPPPRDESAPARLTETAQKKDTMQDLLAMQQTPAHRTKSARSELPKPQITGRTPGASDPGNRKLAEFSAVGTLATPSTGGTAEPNDAPYGDVFFKSYGTNPFIDTEDDHLSTFGLDVDTASYAVVRRYLNDGHLPPPEAVRVEELVNYFDYGDAPPEEAEFALHAEGAPSPFARGDRYYLLRFNLRGREVAAQNRPAAMLTFVVDVSGSMAQENRLGLVKRALGLLLDELRADDRISLVVYGSRGRIVLEPTNNHEIIRRAIMELRPEGSTNAEEGLRLAYEQAARHRRDGAIHRVILCSDGVANVGRTSAEAILERVHEEAQKGIELTTVGFGMGSYNDVLMEQLADRGNGRYAYVDTLDEAHRIFVEDLTGTLMTLAAEARSQIEFNPQAVARYRLLGYENRDIADHRFRDDTVDAGEIGVGHTVTALYEIKLRQEPSHRRAAGLKIATLRLRYGSVARGEMVELERTVTSSDLVHRWEKASPALRLTSLVAEFAEILKGTYWAREGDLETVFRRAQKVSAEFAGDHDVAEFVSLVGRAAEYKKRQ